MNMWLVGAGYWGSKLLAGLDKIGVKGQVIDIRNGQTIDDITDHGPVMLATPLWQHHEQTIALLKRGHDVYVEKPMAETAKQIQAIQQSLSDNQLLMVGHIFVYHPQMLLIKDLIKSGEVGTVQHITSRRLNWGIYQTKTSPILSLATHDISIVSELTGTDCVVSKAQGHVLSGGSQFDRVQFSGQSGKTLFDIDVSWCWPIRTRETVIIGTTGQIVWDQDANKVLLFNNRIENNRAVATDPVVYEYNYNLSPLEYELQHWVDCVETRLRPMTGAPQALSVAYTIEQVQTLL